MESRAVAHGLVGKHTVRRPHIAELAQEIWQARPAVGIFRWFADITKEGSQRVDYDQVQGNVNFWHESSMPR